MATIKNLRRMCKFYKSKCSDCPLQGKCCAHEIPDNADEIVNDWVRASRTDLCTRFLFKIS